MEAKKFAVVYWKAMGDEFIDIYETLEEAESAAHGEFVHLTDYEKKRTNYLAVMAGELDEDECFVMDTAEEITSYIRAEVFR